MAIFKKRDLKYSYNWSAYKNKDPHISGLPNGTNFNRNEGYEVLYMINNMLNDFRLAHEMGYYIEELLRNQLPQEITRQIQVKIWIYENISEHIYY